MKNKRYLKKRIQQICGEVAIEALLYLPSDKAHDIVMELARLQSQTLARISFSFDRGKKEFENGRAYKLAKEAYNRIALKKLYDEFNAKLVEIIKQMNATLTPEQRSANKKRISE